MAVDVSTAIRIDRSRGDVAAYAADPANAPRWYVNIKSVEWHTRPDVAIGARMGFVAHFLRRRLVYTYEITEWVPDRKLVMRTVDGPFPMETTYTWEDVPGGGTLMALRNRGAPRGFSTLVGPFMARAMRRANQKDLSRLKDILEGGHE